MPEDRARYVIHHPDGRWLHHLPDAVSHSTLAVHADGEPMTQVGITAWWAAGHQATRITVTTRTRAKTLKYALRDMDAMSAKYPAELTPEEWEERRDNNGGRTSDHMWELYNQVTAEQPPTETHIDGPFPILEGAEPPAGGPAWEVNLTDSITQRPEYQHLFPGRLLGLRTALIAAIKAMPRVEHCFNGFQDNPDVYVSLRIPYAAPESTFVHDLNSRGKPLRTGHRRPVTVTRSLYLPIPFTVPGDNHAAALAEWDRQVAEWTKAVEEHTVAACNHCRGTGHIPAGTKDTDRVAELDTALADARALTADRHDDLAHALGRDGNALEWSDLVDIANGYMRRAEGLETA